MKKVCRTCITQLTFGAGLVFREMEAALFSNNLCGRWDGKFITSHRIAPDEALLPGVINDLVEVVQERGVATEPVLSASK